MKNKIHAFETTVLLVVKGVTRRETAKWCHYSWTWS